jgi:hypothetical protein
MESKGVFEQFRLDGVGERSLAGGRGDLETPHFWSRGAWEFQMDADAPGREAYRPLEIVAPLVEGNPKGVVEGALLAGIQREVTFGVAEQQPDLLAGVLVPGGLKLHRFTVAASIDLKLVEGEGVLAVELVRTS